MSDESGFPGWFRLPRSLTILALLLMVGRVGWGLGLLCTFGMYSAAQALSPFRVMAGLASGAVGSAIHGAVLLKRIPLPLKRWVIHNCVGFGLGLLMATLIFGQNPPHNPSSCANNYANCTGWNIQSARVFGVAGVFVGLAQWLFLRRFVKWSGWMVIPPAVGGLAAGAWVGWFTDDTIISFANSGASNNFGEAMMGATLFYLPVALAGFGVLIGAGLAVILIQYDWQQRRTFNSSQENSSPA